MGTNSRLVELLDKMLSGQHDPVSTIVENEQARGFKVIRPGDAIWFPASDWRSASIASLNGMFVRLVLLHAVQSNRGALNRTVAGIRSAGMIPTVVDPTRELAATLSRRGWKPKKVGTTFDDRETIWESAT